MSRQPPLAGSHWLTLILCKIKNVTVGSWPWVFVFPQQHLLYVQRNHSWSFAEGTLPCLGQGCTVLVGLLVTQWGHLKQKSWSITAVAWPAALLSQNVFSKLGL